MRPAAVILAVGVAVRAAAAAPVLTAAYVRENSDALWGAFKVTYGRTYGTPAEEEIRRGVFLENLMNASAQQALNPLATFGMTPFSDYTAAEFAPRHTGLRRSTRLRNTTTVFSDAEVATALATSVDWRTKKAVTGVKDQGDCGGCWAFSSTGNIEGQWAIKNSKLVSLSEQELLSCDDYFPCMGCGSGQMSCAWEFLKSERGGHIATEASYPYTSGAKGGPVAKCKGSGSTGAAITGYKDVPATEAQMAAWVAAHGPVSIGAYAIPWKSYTGGIMTNCGSGDIDHAILIVGYGTDNGTDYWIIKNSWGTSWGESGYIRLARGKDLCKITSEPCTATV